MTPKVLCETQKFCDAENLIFSVLKLPQCGLVIFHRYEHLSTNRLQKFQNILQRKLRKCLGQLLQKNVKHKTEQDVDNLYTL